MTILKYMNIYIFKMKKQTKRSETVSKSNREREIDIHVNIYMTSHFPGLVQVLE
jgi:hypothetical protein